jgi:hypothetical protein
MENQKKLSKRMLGVGAGLFVASIIFQTEESKKDHDSIQNVMGFSGALLLVFGVLAYIDAKNLKK